MVQKSRSLGKAVNAVRAVALAAAIVGTATTASVAQAQVIAAPGAQIFPKIARGGNEYLVVWQDGRTAGSLAVYGALVQPNGVVSPAAGIALTTGLSPNSDTEPVVAYRAIAGPSFLVAWEVGPGNSQIFARAVGDDGSLIGAPFLVNPTIGILPTIACGTSGDCAIAYIDPTVPSSFQATAQLVLPVGPGSVLPPVDVSNNPSGKAALSPLITATGNNYYLIWQTEALNAGTNGIISGGRLADSGSALTVLDPTPLSISSGPIDIPFALASDGTNVLVTWTRGNGYPAPMFGRLISLATGLPLGPEFAITPPANVGNGHGSVVFDGCNYHVIWTAADTHRVVRRRFTAAGAALDAAPVLTSGTASAPGAAAAAVGFGLVYNVWDDSRTGAASADVYGQGYTFTCGAGAAALASSPLTEALISTIPAPPVPAAPLPVLALLALLLLVGGLFLLRGRTPRVSLSAGRSRCASRPAGTPHRAGASATSPGSSGRPVAAAAATSR
jgi:hypothetical protein